MTEQTDKLPDVDEARFDRIAGRPADILVVDDNKPNLAAIEVALGDLGRRLVKAQSGSEALRQLLERDFALILLDVQMPGMDGFETARLIRERERTRHVPIIFITAYTRDDSQILQGYRLGAADFLFKPIVPEVLRAKAQIFVDLEERTLEVQRQAIELRQLERERWETERLRQESRNKDEFLAVLAHELRNPLSPIVTGISLLERQDPDNEGLKRIRGMMDRQASHLVRLIDDLLDVARISSGKIHVDIDRVDLGDAVRQAIDSVSSLIAQKNHTLTVAPMPAGKDAIFVAADRHRLAQIIANLLNNAARYTDPGGTIELHCEREGDEAVIQVIDNGKGISSAMLETIFDSFVQEDSHGAGLGLGLALVKRLVALHDGRVRATSDGAAKGSTFTVWLPLAGKGTKKRIKAKKPVPTKPARPLDIVLIEDEVDIRTSVQALLESWGHRVRTAADGAHGIDLIESQTPDVAIVDIAMPGIDGYTVARRVREADHGDIRLIAMTGFGRDEDRKRAFEAGFNDHITKPARPETLQLVLGGIQ